MTPTAHRAAVLTPPSTGAIAVVRLAGPDPISVIKTFLKYPNRLSPRMGTGGLSYARWMDGADVLDDVVLSVEPVLDDGLAVDICCHGGTRIVQRILELLQQEGVALEAPSAAIFWPAETTIALEATEAMMQARTLRAAMYASKLRVELPSRIERLKAIAHSSRSVWTDVIDDLTRDNAAATTLLHGIRLALIGPPNSGKSTLFNTLVGRHAAVTSPVPGTTRDWVSEAVEFSGLHVELIDTAGQHATHDELEQYAIDAGKTHARLSHAALLILDGTQPLPPAIFDSMDASARKTWVVTNKSDLGFRWSAQEIAAIQEQFACAPFSVSAQIGEGCAQLKQAILEYFGLADPQSPSISLFTSRQMDLAGQLRSNPAQAESLVRKMLSDPAGVQTR